MWNDWLKPECQTLRAQVRNQPRPQIDCCSRDAQMVAVEGNQMGGSDAVIHAGGKAVLIVQQSREHIAIAAPCLGDRQKITALQPKRYGNLRKMLRLPGDGGLCLPLTPLAKTA